MRVQEEAWLCDFCTGREPVWRYPVPPGTTILHTLDPSSGDQQKLISAGGFGACGPCARVVESGRNVPRRLASRMFRANPLLRRLPPWARARGKAAWVSRLEVLVPQLGERRPCVRGEDPMDAKSLWPDARDQAGAEAN